MKKEERVVHSATTSSGVEVQFIGPAELPDRLVVLWIEPFTLTAIIWAVISGILAYVGSQAAAAVLGNNMHDLFRNLVGAIKDIVRTALDEQEMSKCIEDVESFKILLQEYNNAPDTRFDTLKGLLDRTMFPVGRLENLQAAYPVAAFAYLAAALLRLVVLQEYSKRTNNQADFKNFTDFATYTAKQARAASLDCPPSTMRE